MGTTKTTTKKKLANGRDAIEHNISVVKVLGGWRWHYNKLAISLIVYEKKQSAERAAATWLANIGTESTRLDCSALGLSKHPKRRWQNILKSLRREKKIEEVTT